MESVGQRLREARESKGLSIEEISKMTKLSEKSLIALENNRYEELPAPTYIKGFLKLYAQSVGLDPAKVAEDFRKGQVVETKQVLVLEGEKVKIPRLWEVFAALALRTGTSLIASIRRLVGGLVHKVHPKVWMAMGGLLLLIVLIKWVFPTSAHSPVTFVKTVKVQDHSESPAALIRPMALPQQNVPSTVVSTPSPQVQEKPVMASPSKSSSVPLVLVVRAKQTVWLRVRCDSQQAFEGSLKKGKEETWKADRFFILRMGNPDAMQFTLNGKELGRVGLSPGKIRDVRLTKDGWYVGD